ncbi:hypothetical protein [Novilysobacter luteus]|nr:hypothetical protein [Lysobacter luteus]
MSRLDMIPDRALQLASSVGDSLRHAVPGGAGRWLDAGAKLGAIKGGARVAGFFVRRHPALVAATAAGAGLLWYAARRKAKQAETAPIDGSAKRVEARRSNGSTARKRSSTARKGTRSRSTASTPTAD